MPLPVERITGLLEDLRTSRPVVAYVAPVASRITAYTPTVARVDVWTVSVLGTRRLGAASSSWSTQTVSLSWNGSWNVSGVRSRPGPTPACAPEAVTPFRQILHDTADMQRYDDAGR